MSLAERATPIESLPEGCVTLKISIFLLIFLALVAGSSGEEQGSRVIRAYSDRAKQILFLARFKAGKDGAPELGIDQIFEAIVVEDQGAEAMYKFLCVDPTTTVLSGGNAKSASPPFFSPDVAAGILARFDQLSQHLEPVPHSRDMPISADGERALTVALSLARELHSDKVEPLHLLGAALRQQSSKSVRIFSEYGITEERVVALLREASDGTDSNGSESVHR
jgi:hypothetical protein